MSLSPAQIASALKIKPDAVEANWPLIVAALQFVGIDSPMVQVAAAATVMVETGNFRPIEERGTLPYFTKLYEDRVDLGNTHPGDGNLYHGRGFVQITGRANYKTYSLEDQPNLALEPSKAAWILAKYFKDRGIDHLSDNGDWLKVRIRVNGINRKTGLPNGWTEFQGYVHALLEVVNG